VNQICNFICLIHYIFRQGILIDLDVFKFIVSTIPRACRLKKMVYEVMYVLACFVGLRDHMESNDDDIKSNIKFEKKEN